MNRPEAATPVVKSAAPVQRYTMNNISEGEFREVPNPAKLQVLQIFALRHATRTNTRDRDSLRNLGRFSSLRTLVISGDLMNDTTLKHVLDLPQLEAVVFYNCNFTNQGVQQLSLLPNLRSVGFYQSGVTTIGADELRAKLPGATIEVFGANQTGKIFDGSGCYTTKFAKEHL